MQHRALPPRCTPSIVAAILWTFAAACGDSLPSSTTSIPTFDPATSSGNSNTTVQAASLNTMSKVIDSDFPDPYVWVDANSYFAYSTNSNAKNIPVRQSNDLVHWAEIGDALPTIPSWASQTYGSVWSPTVMKVAANDYRLIFGASHATYNVECLGVARSTTPQGPYTNVGSGPIQCATSTQGSVDGSFVQVGDGNIYLVFKSSVSGQTAQIFIQQLASDALSTVGSASALLSPSYAWEGNVLEAPFINKANNTFYLSYSANYYKSTNFAMGLATATSLLGPYTKRATPIMAANANLIGVGAQGFFTGLDNNQYMVFQTWDSTAFNYRPTWIAPVALLVQNGNLPVGF